MVVTKAQEVVTGQKTFDKFCEFHLKVRIRPLLEKCFDGKKWYAVVVAVAVATAAIENENSVALRIKALIKLIHFYQFSIINKRSNFFLTEYILRLHQTEYFQNMH